MAKEPAEVPLDMVVTKATKSADRTSEYEIEMRNTAETKRHYWLVSTPDEGDPVTHEGTLEPGETVVCSIELPFPRSSSVSLQFTHSGERTQASAMLLGPIVG